MRNVYRQLLRHSAVYAVGQILARLVSLLLLPIYTRYLLPADYAAIAILDLTTGILAILIGSGMAVTLVRYHFEREDEAYRGRLWTTGIAFVATTATAVVVPAWLSRSLLAEVALGPEVPDGTLYFGLVLPQLWATILITVAEAYLRVRKRSGLYVTLSLLRLLVNVALNLIFLVELEMGVVAILLGNLLTSAIFVVVQLSILFRGLERFGIDPALIAPLWRYGRPLIVTALFSLLMHNGDRYILRFFVSMEAIGIYSLAYVLGQGVNTMLLFPFSSIWNVTIYEIAAGPEPEKVFADVFRRSFHLLALAMLGVALFADPTLRLLVAAEYWPAAGIVPVVCLAYLFFSLHDQFRTPVLLAKRTSMLPPVFAVATLSNVLANVALIPAFGVFGAAWASVITFATFSFFGLSRYRRIARYPYPLRHCARILGGMIVTHVSVRVSLEAFGAGLVTSFAVAALAWGGWAVFLFREIAPAVLSALLRAEDPGESHTDESHSANGSFPK